MPHPPLGILQNNKPSMIIDNAPLFNFLQRSKAAETGEVIVQAAISDARRLSRAVVITHLRRAKKCEVSNLSTQAKRNPGVHHKDSGRSIQAAPRRSKSSCAISGDSGDFRCY